jgi:hypothetical protein
LTVRPRGGLIPTPYVADAIERLFATDGVGLSRLAGT